MLVGGGKGHAPLAPFWRRPCQSRQQSSRLSRAKRLSGGAKFEIKLKIRCLQKSKLVDWEGGKHVDWRSLAPLGACPVLE